MHFYQRIKDLREDADKKQSEIAELLGMKRQQYARYETGTQEIPLHHLITLAKYYNTSLDFLAGLINNPRPLIDENKTKNSKEKKLLEEYHKNPQLQIAIDKLLNIK